MRFIDFIDSNGDTVSLRLDIIHAVEETSDKDETNITAGNFIYRVKGTQAAVKTKVQEPGGSHMDDISRRTWDAIFKLKAALDLAPSGYVMSVDSGVEYSADHMDAMIGELEGTITKLKLLKEERTRSEQAGA
jgi:hypothetical protein